jgi:hypothetical protein
MTISSAPSGLVAFIVMPSRLKPGLGFHGPSGRNRVVALTLTVSKRYSRGVISPGLVYREKLETGIRPSDRFRWPAFVMQNITLGNLILLCIAIGNNDIRPVSLIAQEMFTPH